MRVCVSSSQSLDKTLSISLSPVSGSVKKSVGIVCGAVVTNDA